MGVVVDGGGCRWVTNKNNLLFGAIQVLRNADGGGGLIFWKKAL